MVLSIIGSPVFIGSDDIGRIEFLPTDMDALDARGKPTGEKLLIARTPHTNWARNCINAHLLARGETHGSMVMHKDGTAYVMRRGTWADDPRRTPRTPVMEAGHDFATVHRVKHGIQFYPDNPLILADPDFATHPAVNMTWYESASQAAAIEDADPRFRVRMMRDPEARRFITWDGKYTEAQVKARAHLYRDGVTGTVSVVGKVAAQRTTDEGFVDVFGNVWISTDGANAPLATGADMGTVARILLGASWLVNPEDARVDSRYAYRPGGYGGASGVRFVAIFRSS